MVKVKPPKLENVDKILQIDDEVGGGWSKGDLFEFINESGEKRNRLYLAEIDKEVVGFITAEFPTKLSEPIIINKISVQKAFRLNGAGRALFAHIYAIAELRKYNTLEIVVNENNLKAVKFIQKIAHIEKSTVVSGAYHLTITINH